MVDELKSCVNELENDDDVQVVELMDPNVAKLYAKSNRAKVSIPIVIPTDIYECY